MPHATLNGIRSHYDVHGEGEPVLLINGLAAPSAKWLFQVRGFTIEYSEAFIGAVLGCLTGIRR